MTGVEFMTGTPLNIVGSGKQARWSRREARLLKPIGVTAGRDRHNFGIASVPGVNRATLATSGTASP